jgi:eukaryotic-like serine/threonine-protein kinase
MRLAAGTRIGPYEVVASLGAGGMGEVYRARDTRLNREVAVKVQPISLHADPALRARFEREAQALAALNHPHIAAIYDVIDVSDHRAIVMELVPGSTLAERMASGPVLLRDAIRYGIHISDALSVAHAAGIVHRDLKPSNIVITENGSAKVLDFGIAKHGVPADAATAETTIAAAFTEERVVIGTAGYMSPEQVHGRQVDARSDIFSLGVVMYEAISGRRAFQGDTTSALMASVLRDDPPTLRTLVPAVPRTVERCVMRCLDKDPRRRYQHAADLQMALEDARDDLSAPETVPVVATKNADTPSIGRTLLWPLVYVVAGLVIGVLGLIALVPPPSSAILTPRYRPLITEATSAANPAWSPDGKTLAYLAEANGEPRVFVRGLDSAQSTQLTSEPASQAQAPFWSHDASRIYFVRNRDCSLVSVSVGGGEPTPVVGAANDERTQATNSCRASISPDGRTIAFARGPVGNMQLWTLETGTSTPRMLNPTGMPRPLANVQAIRFAPDGRTLAIQASTTALNQSRGIWVVSWPEASARLMFGDAPYVASNFSIGWMPDSRRVVISGSPLDGGLPRLLVADTAANTLNPLSNGKDAATSPAVSPDGSRIAFVSRNSGSDLIQFPIAGGSPEIVLATSRSESYPDVSASGLLAYVTDADGASAVRLKSATDTWSRAIIGGGELKADIREVRLSPDGQRVAIGTYASEHLLWIVPSAGGSPVRLDSESTDQHGPSWSPDGNWIAYRRMVNGSWSIVKRPIGGGSIVRLDDANPGGAATDWSPDGRWIAHCRPEGVHLVSPDGGPPRVLAGLHTCAWRFSRDGSKLLALRRGSNRRWELTIWDVAAGREVRVVALPVAPATELEWPAMAADDAHVIVSATTSTSDIWLLEQFEPPTASWTWWLRR